MTDTTTSADEESPLVAHARRELELIGEDWIEPQLRVVRAFAESGHSGASAMAALAQLERLLRFENLSPLTDDPAEWIDQSDASGEPLWQSARNPQAFSRDGGKTYWLLDEREAAAGPVDRCRYTLPGLPERGEPG